MHDHVDAVSLGSARHTHSVDLIMHCGVEPSNCAVGGPYPGRTPLVSDAVTHRPGASRVFHAPASTSSPVDVAELAEQPNIVVAWTAVPDQAHASSRRDRPSRVPLDWLWSHFPVAR